ncbi:MAG: MBL fold metallo-hydrolase [Candidatus Micrarchaeia archaeon]|jgi:glyoxylase-like metal-dependent hydrolase (beta-lactamase superfamily II)
MFEKIATHTSMLRTEERTCGTVYLIEEAGKRLVIDAGDGKLAELDFAPDLCILTHGHYDHSTGVKENWKEVLLHPAEFSFGGPHIHVPKNAKPNPMKPMAFGSHMLEFFHTPGHTDGSICIFDKTTGLLFSGDTKFADGIWGRTDLGGSDEEMAASLLLIEKIPYKLLCPGHGELEEKE